MPAALKRKDTVWDPGVSLTAIFDGKELEHDAGGSPAMKMSFRHTITGGSGPADAWKAEVGWLQNLATLDSSAGYFSLAIS